MNRLRTSLWLVEIGFGLSMMVRGAQEQTILIQNVRSGAAHLRQQGRLTILEIRSGNGSLRLIALSHPSDYRQGTNPP